VAKIVALPEFDLPNRQTLLLSPKYIIFSRRVLDMKYCDRISIYALKVMFRLSSDRGKSGNRGKVREFHFLENIWEKSGNLVTNLEFPRKK